MVRCLLALLVAAALSAPSWNDPRFVSVRDGINNNPASTWKAAIHSNIPYDNEESLRRLCGSKMDATLLRQTANNKEPLGSDPVDNTAGQNGSRRLQNFALNYDLRQIYPTVKSIGTIVNQGSCGSCWAVSAITALTDNLGIATRSSSATNQRILSSQDALECYGAANQGCQGGPIHGAFIFAQTNGVVSGGDFGNFNVCKPYFLNTLVPSYGNAVAPSCKAYCPSSLFRTSYIQDKTYTNGYKFLVGNTVAETVVNMKTAIVNAGSIVVGIDVYSDFYYYKSGVYSRSGYGSSYVGGHAVKVVGWGYDAVSRKNFWTIANSWGIYWGEKGFVRFEAGTNHCRIETWALQAILK